MIRGTSNGWWPSEQVLLFNWRRPGGAFVMESGLQSITIQRPLDSDLMCVYEDDYIVVIRHVFSSRAVFNRLHEWWIWYWVIIFPWIRCCNVVPPATLHAAVPSARRFKWILRLYWYYPMPISNQMCSFNLFMEKQYLQLCLGLLIHL